MIKFVAFASFYAAWVLVTLCPNQEIKDRGSRLLRSADTTATVADAATGLGAVCTAAGIVLVLMSGAKRPTEVRVRPGATGLGGAGLVLDGVM